MKKCILMMMQVVAALFIAAAANGQAPEAFPASAGWELSDPSNGGTGVSAATSGNVTAQDESAGSNTQIRDFSGYEGSQRSQISGGAWPANQSSPIADVYIQFAMAPLPYSVFYLDTIALEMTATAINTMKAEIHCSTDPAFGSYTQVLFNTGITNNYVPREDFFKVSSAVDLTVNDGETLYVRVYFWVDDPDERTGKYLCLKNVLISGFGESLAAPASVKWFENGVQEPVITGGLLAGNPFYSDSLTLYNQTTDLPLNGAGKDVTAGAIHTVSQVWAAELDTVSYLFFGFAVSPKVGGTFHIDSVKMNIGGWFESNFKAAVYYSLNEDFSDAALLINDTQLPGNALNSWSAKLDTSIYTGETIYLRVYPHNTAAAGWAKLVAVNDIMIKGTTTGITADPPVVTTADLSYLSTTFVTCGGNVPSDGGSVVTEKGVVWDTAAGPTINDSRTSDGSGSGSFVSQVTGLTPGTTYHLRAYATNKAGTSYGEVRTFATLDSIVVPSVSTVTVSTILVKTAESGGNVTDWGGDTVKVRGICWNTTGTPTIEDSYTENGSGLGAFNSTMYPLSATTTYYVRAFATNSAGTGYGGELSFATQAPAPDVTKTVAKDGSGDYTTVQAAFDDVPDLYTGTWTINIKPGIYYEKLVLGKNKVNVVLRADHPDSTILTYDDNANTSNGSGGTVGTSGSYSVAIDASDFAAYKITFRNTNQVAQAVALRTNGDRQSYYHCRMRGYQDTYYTYGLGRIYMKDCYIEGAVDYIFGQATVVFDSCELKVVRYGAPVTAASTNVNSTFGYVFRNCKIMTDQKGYDGNTISSIYLGRPWQGNPKVVYMYCYEPSTLASGAWTSMTSGLNPLFAEYKCYGPGYKPELRSTNINYKGIQLTDEEAAAYTLENIFAKTTNPAFGIDWMPDTSSFKLSQSISFDPLEDRKLNETPFDLEGTATSNLPLSYESSNTGIATISGSTVTLTGMGTIDITASQEGNFLYNPAVSVVQTLTVGEPSGLENGTAPVIRLFPNPAGDKIIISGLTGVPEKIMIFDGSGQKRVEKILDAGTSSIDISFLPAGLYLLKIREHIIKFVIE
jgi:pectin methylesterase-like acyl-CoA thioesterase